MQNLELKVPVKNADILEATVKKIGASFQWTRRQKDTYFSARTGKLKLREQKGSPAELIAYHRPDLKQLKLSEYTLFKVDDPPALKSILQKSIGLRGVVSKQRSLYLWKNVRIHLDRVAGLGTFLEFEAVLDQVNNASVSRQRLLDLSLQLGISLQDTLSGGYLDLLEENGSNCG